MSPVLGGHGRTLVTMLIAVASVTWGDILMAQAMRGIEVRYGSLGQVWETGVEVFTTPRIWAAIGFMATFFVLWLVVLSWADLSYALPLTALTYVFNAFLAGPFLGEHVSPLRWAGTLIIFVGVVVVSLTHARAAER